MHEQAPAIIGIGRNYAEHARELGNEAPDRPMIFLKNPASRIGDGDPIIIPRICEEGGPQVDFEGELAVIISRPCRHVSEDAAMDHVGGYAVANDVSARWWQKTGAGGQFCRGKSFDTFCPVSTVVPVHAVADPAALRIRTWLNGELMQDDSTDLMLHPVPTLIAELSRGMTLLPGTILLTGTPKGVGAGRTPPRFLVDGDRVEVSIEGVGSLSNPVIEER